MTFLGGGKVIPITGNRLSHSWTDIYEYRYMQPWESFIDTRMVSVTLKKFPEVGELEYRL